MTRKYSSTSVEQLLNASIGAGDTSISLANTAAVTALLGGVTLTAGNVDQFTIAVDPDTASEEIIFVRGTSGNQLTGLVRGQAGTSATTHTAGSTIKHVLTSNDLDYFETGITNAVNKVDITAKGDIFAGTANDAYSVLNVGTNERRLVADSSQATGLKYVADTTNYAIAAKGDLLAGTAADTLQAVTVGADGTTLVADSTATPGVSWTGAQIAKNYIINGNLSINERTVTTGTLSSTASFTADHFFARRTAGSSGAQYEYLTSTSLDAFPNAIRIQRNSGNTATDTLIFGQTIETANSRQLQGKTVTFSFWARKGANFSATSDALQVRVYTGTGTNQTGLGNGYTGTATPISSNATLTTSWQRFSFTGTIATTATQVQVIAQYVPVGTAGAADNFDVTGFQLEVGSTATPFTLAGGGLYLAELNLCRRYYERWTADNANMRLGMGFAVSSTNTRITIYYKVKKLAAIGVSDNLNTEIVRSSNNTGSALTSYGIQSSNTENITLTATASGASFTTGEYVELRTIGAGGYQGWESEIG
jgi:hypothetical protein